jgi:hypothetical protein
MEAPTAVRPRVRVGSNHVALSETLAMRPTALLPLTWEPAVSGWSRVHLGSADGQLALTQGLRVADSPWPYMR